MSSDVLFTAIDSLVPPAPPAGDWTDVLARAGVSRRPASSVAPSSPTVAPGRGAAVRRRRRAYVAVALVAAALAVAFATPLGAAIAHGLGGFSDWLTGSPGTPASKSAQERFAAANGRSWLGFPRNTRLRHLITTRTGGEAVSLYGFRSGKTTLCLRLTVTGVARLTTMQCAPLADLRRRDAPVRVLIADQPVGRGAKSAWYGVDRFHSAALQITAGITDDNVRAVVLRDDHGRHQVPVHADAFLYVATGPEVGQRVQQVWAKTASGLIIVPYVPAPFGMSAGPTLPILAPAVSVSRPALHGRIGWLDRREQRGQPLTALPARVRATLLGYRGGGTHDRIVYGRMLAPDPSRPVRVVVTLNAHRHGGPAAGICVATVVQGSSGGGCAPYPQVFEHTPINFSESGGGAAEFVEVSGVVSDQVARLRALLANRQSILVPLRDNVFDVQLPAARLPARLVAYDTNGHVIGASQPVQTFGAGGTAQAPGKPKLTLRASAPGGAYIELLLGPAAGGGTCFYLRTHISARNAGVMTNCRGRTWQGPPVQLISMFSQPALFIAAQVGPNVKTVRIKYADGTTSSVKPTRGFVLTALAASHQSPSHGPVGLVALDSRNRILGTETISKPPTPHPAHQS